MKRKNELWLEIKKNKNKITQILLCQKGEGQEVILLRMYGEYTENTVPSQLEEGQITEIGAYCFARSSKLPGMWENEEGIHTPEKLVAFAEENQLHEIAGEYVETVVLPETVTKLGNCAFYNCRNLKQISLGPALREIGSDVFMNCRKLKTLDFHCAPKSSTGLKEILGRMASDVLVQFQENENVQAKLLYPEYFETYDEIAPAHIFGRNIVGEGFRARQCFINGCIDFTAYDAVFPQICVDETAMTATAMAFYRVRYPVELSQEAGDRYREYLKNNGLVFARKQIKGQRLEELKFLCENLFFTESGMQELIAYASEREWPEGVASLMSWKHAFYEKSVADKYAFDDWE